MSPVASDKYLPIDKAGIDVAAYLVSSQTLGMSAVQFQRQLGLSRYETAFQILHKLSGWHGAP